MKVKNYLKYYRDTLFYFRDNYNLKVSDIEFLFFVYDLKYFTNTDVKKGYKCSLTFLTRNMPKLLEKGYLAIYEERARHRARKYMISHKGKIMITRFYNILEQVEAKI